MAEGFNGGPPRAYRRRSLAEHREAVERARAELALLTANELRITADSEAKILKIDLQILKVKQEAAKSEAKAAARIRRGEGA